MTPQQFFQALRDVRAKFSWHYTYGRVIAAKHASHPNLTLDPLTVLVAVTRGEWLRVTQPMLAGEKLGLDFDFTHKVMLASGIPTHPMRCRLLMACGLVEDSGDEQFLEGSLFSRTA